MWPALVIGILVVSFGIFWVIMSAKHSESDSEWGTMALVGTIIIAGGIALIGLYTHDIGKQMDPTSPVTEQGHVYEVLDAMVFKGGYLVSFQKMIPEIKEDDEQVRFFEEIPPNPFKSTLKEGKEVYVPFRLPAPNPVK